MKTSASREEREDFDLERFVLAQDSAIDTALAELEAGRKESHWMWFIFPQFDGLGSSSMARRYAIKSTDEAHAYLQHPILGDRLQQCCGALLAIEGKSAYEIMGDPDDMKLRSSMTLFSLVEPSKDEFKRVLEKYFDGRPDDRTIALVNAAS